ncbi:hypothetical protein F5B22DRAFT_618849 [Xylaria bambusicola]|uniref:uncharacterized protein n=1 Tax=Xylaria bambusicola TaxID=326684 RepID=UPI0020083B16|nr:uncharacterized protein F5B22DRAFT_618849 [Xylaria bambusicola]KAI0509015.1 hypothetical protein F5B22DRAFT_618849 [Xylaria bambusicola]
MKLFTVSALLSAVILVKADYTAFHFLNRTIPENVPVGTEIDLEWVSKDYTGPFDLSVLAFNTTPYGYTPGPFGQYPLFDSKTLYLASKSTESCS